MREFGLFSFFFVRDSMAELMRGMGDIKIREWYSYNIHDLVMIPNRKGYIGSKIIRTITFRIRRIKYPRVTSHERLMYTKANLLVRVYTIYTYTQYRPNQTRRALYLGKVLSHLLDKIQWKWFMSTKFAVIFDCVCTECSKQKNQI